MALVYMHAGSLEALEVVTKDQYCSLVPMAQESEAWRTSVFPVLNLRVGQFCSLGCHALSLHVSNCLVTVATEVYHKNIIRTSLP